MIWYQLFRPVDYLRIEDSAKWKIDYAIPLFMSSLSLFGFYLLDPKPQVFLKDGLLQQLASLLSILPGFYLAALAAIATFHRPDMDNYMPAPTPTVETLAGGHWHVINLTRRRYLSLMFGYLTLLSLALFITVIVANASAESINRWVGTTFSDIIKHVFLGIFWFFCWHMIAVTMFGLYQLSDRMHQPDYKVNTPGKMQTTDEDSFD